MAVGRRESTTGRISDGTKRFTSPTLVGRRDELALAASAVSNPPAVVAVEGEAGIGKSRLVSELVGHPAVAGRRVVTGSCRRIREPFPLGPLLEVVGELGPDLSAARLSPLTGALRPLVPEIADVLPPPLPPLDDRDAERHRVFRALVEVFGAVGPAVMILEDLHWADGHTIDFLSYLLSDPPAALAVLLTYRDEEIAPEVRALTTRPPQSLEAVRIALRPLDATGTGALVAAILDTEEISEEFAAHLCERASGLPFAIEQLLALLRERGKLIPLRGGWARKSVDELGVPAGIRDSVLERVGRLGADARSAIEVAAVLQTPVPVAVLVAACQLPEVRVRTGLAEAFGSGLLTEHANRVGFRHVLAAQAVYEGIPLPRRQALHGRAADVLGGLRPVPLGQQAHHLRMAERPMEWAHAAERAADQALALGDAVEAVRLLHDVVHSEAVLAPPEERGRIGAKYGRAAWEANRADGYDGLSALLDQEPELPVALRGEVRFWQAMLMYSTGADQRQRYDLFALAADELAAQPDLRAWALVNLALPMVPDVPLSEHLAWLRRAEAALPRVDDRLLKVLLHGQIATVQVATGDRAWRHHAAAVRELTGGAPKHRLELAAFFYLAEEASFAGHHQVVGELLSAASAGASQHISHRLGHALRTRAALHAYLTGTWDGLREALPSVLDRRQASPRIATLDLLLPAAGLAVAEGEVDQAKQLFDEIDREVDADGNAVDALPIATAAKVRRALALGEVEAAAAAVDDLTHRLAAKPIWVPVTRALPWAVQALTAAGRYADATALVAQAGRILADLDAPLAPAALSHARGFLTAEKDRAEAAARFLTAAEGYERLAAPYEAALAREQAALALFGREDPSAADSLRTAAATYQRLGSRMDLDRAHEIARRHGVALPARYRGGRRGYGNQLSPRQRRVAELAASGRTNQQIAEELFVSVSTVKQHLSAIMRKLDVPSRAALVHRMAVDRPASE